MCIYIYLNVRIINFKNITVTNSFMLSQCSDSA